MAHPLSIPVSAPAVSPTGEPHPRRYLVLGIVSVALLMASVDQTIVATALTALQHDLHAPVNWSSWTITVYALGQILVMPLAGRFSDQYGRRTVFLSAVALFTGASLACGLAGNIYVLVALRAVQAIGGGAFMPSATGIVSDFFGRDRDRAVGLFTSIFPIGGLLGPVLGGVFVTYWSWRGIFLVNVPLGVGLLVVGALLLPRSRRSVGHTPDFVGIGLLLLGLLAAMLATSLLASAHAVPVVVGYIVAVAALGAFVRHSARDPDAVIPMRLLRGHGFGVVHLVNFMSGATTLGFGALIPLYAHDRYSLSALSSGTLLTARAVGVIAVAGVTTFALRRVGYRLPMAVGFALMAIGLVLTALRPPVGLPPYVWLAISSAVTGIGMGTSIPAANNAVLHLAPDSAAAISGVRGMFRQAGGITGISIVTVITAQSANPGAVQADAFLVFAMVLLALIPLVSRVPDHKGSW